ncbi:MAG: hypothetical protein WAU33_15320 [Candidatus Binataceae bacterium]
MNRVTTASFCAIMMVLALVAAGCGSSSSSPSPSHHFSFTIDQGIWVANGTNVLEYTSPFTSRTPNIAPSVAITNSAGFLSTQGVLFDTVGDLWVIDGGALATSSTGDAFPAIDEFTAGQIASGGTLDLTPAVQITGDATTLAFPQQAVFDSTGNMWVTDNSAGQVDVFTADQLVDGGNVAPFATLTTNTQTDVFDGPLGIVFDSSGDLWVANNGDTSIFEFDAATVTTVLGGGTTSAEPNVILSSADNSIEGPWALVFSTLGDLWSSNANSPFTVVAFDGADLGTSGSPAPGVTFSPVNVKHVPSLNSPNGLAFDDVDDLAVANSVPTVSIAIFASDQLGDSGKTKPKVLISGSNTGLVAPAGDAFGPEIP